MVDLDRFDLDGVTMRINRLETQGKQLFSADTPRLAGPSVQPHEVGGDKVYIHPPLVPHLPPLLIVQLLRSRSSPLQLFSVKQRPSINTGIVHQSRHFG